MKTRLTITLPASTLKQVDRLIDKKNIRNRSHAIEYLIEKSLEPDISTAVILAGGHKNENSFKPLTVLGNKPLVFYTLDLLKKHGVKKVIFSTNQQGKQLQDLLKDGSDYDLNIQYVYEESPQGTAGAIKQLDSLLPSNQPFYVLAGDILTTIDLTDLAAFHTKNQAVVTMAVKPRPTQDTYDNVFVQGHTVVDFKASTEDQVVSIVNTGVYIFEPEVLEMLPAKTPSMLERDVFPQLTQSGKMLAFPFQGVWFDISSDDNYQKALESME
jgi:mannose-1-phosphate guanylyltransferase / phosphomannomutase